MLTFDVTTMLGFHTLISLIALVIGVVVTIGLATSQTMPGLTALFLITAVLTNVTGFFLPAKMFLPSHVVAMLSLVALLAATVARYGFHYSGTWRWIYIVGAILGVYFDAFVAVIQFFQKIPSLKALAPNGSEPPFAITQGVVLLFFVATGFSALRRFHPR